MTHPQKSGCAGILAQLFGTSKPAVKTSKPPLVPSKPPEEPSPPEKEEKLPYHLTQSLLSPAEISFYHILQQALGNQVTICSKVSLGDLFYPKTGDRAANQSYRNKIDRKHVDFLVCDPRSMQPLLGIELDDSSHQRADRQERDDFVERVFEAAGLPLFRQPVRHSYNVETLSVSLKEILGLNGPEPAPVEPTEVGSRPEAVQPAQPVAVRDEPVKDPSSQPPLSAEGVPLCPKCNQPMVLRTVKKQGPHHGKQFWGCQGFPRCRGVRAYQ